MRYILTTKLWLQSSSLNPLQSPFGLFLLPYATCDLQTASYFLGGYLESSVRRPFGDHLLHKEAKEGQKEVLMDSNCYFGAAIWLLVTVAWHQICFHPKEFTTLSHIYHH